MNRERKTKRNVIKPLCAVLKVLRVEGEPRGISAAVISAAVISAAIRSAAIRSACPEGARLIVQLFIF